MGSPADLLTYFYFRLSNPEHLALQSINDRFHILDAVIYFKRIPLNTYNHMLNSCPTMKESLI
jgi:hypothetical protein